MSAALLETVGENIDRWALIPQGSSVLLAVSGGVDSMVLWDLLRRFAEKRSWRIEVAHFNHKLRAEASDGDEAFVRKQAEQLGVPFHIGKADVAAAARAQGISVEMAGRSLRHKFLTDTARHRGIGIIALAHHADDQVETFWLRLLRGDVGPGLGGMRWRRPAGEGVTLVRPLLNVTRSAIEDYAKANGIAFREDESNADLNFQRSCVRHAILPELEQFQPQLHSITLRAAETFAAEKDFLAQEAQQWLRTKAPAFPSLHPALQREILRLQLLQRHIRPTAELIEQLRSADSAVSVAPNSSVVRLRTGELQQIASEKNEFNPARKELSITGKGDSNFGALKLSWEFVAVRGQREPCVEYFDVGRLGSRIVLRHWRPGDRFQPIGAATPAKLQDLFTNLKVEDRRGRVLAVTQSGVIFWVEGLRIGEEAKVTVETKSVLRWSWRRTVSSSMYP